MSYLFHMIIYLSIYTIVALSLNLVVGYCGLINLAHAGYFAVGSYAYALATLTLGWGFVPSMFLGVGIAVVLSLTISLPAWRFKGNTFVIFSIAVQALLFSLLYNWCRLGEEPGTWSNLTNGPSGLAGISRPVILSVKCSTMWSIALLSVALAITCSILTWLMVCSPWGRFLQAVRDDELAARGLGKSARSARVQAFIVTCGMVAIAGALYASYVGYVDPSISSLDESILMLCMVIVGGTGNFRGPLIGALVLLAIPEILRFLQIPDAVAANCRLLIYGFALVIMMHLRPQGLMGTYRVQ